jgi:hypothetical protein
MTRREFFGFTKNQFIGATLTGIGINQYGEAIGELIAKPFIGIVDNIKYNDFFEQYFLPHNKFHIVFATEGVPKGVPTYSNEAHAIRCINNELGISKKVLKDSFYEIEQNHNDSCIALGGSGTNLFTRNLLGHPDTPKFSYKINSQISYNLNYSILKLKYVPKAIREEDGKEKLSNRYAIVDKNKNIVVTPDYGKNGEIKTDYLLITKIKLTPYSGDLISFAGLHGPSIRGIENLISGLSNNDKKVIETKLKTVDTSFQMIFKLENIISKNFICEDNKKTFAPREIILEKDKIIPIKQAVI